MIPQQRGTRHKQPRKAAGKTAMTALGPQVNCDDHAKKQHRKMPEMCVCVCAFGAPTGKTGERAVRKPKIEKD